MACSRRRSPCCGLCGRTDKWWKQLWHRNVRRRNRQLVQTTQEPRPSRTFPRANLQASPKEVKHWFGPRHTHRERCDALRQRGWAAAWRK